MDADDLLFDAPAAGAASSAASPGVATAGRAAERLSPDRRLARIAGRIAMTAALAGVVGGFLAGCQTPPPAAPPPPVPAPPPPEPEPPPPPPPPPVPAPATPAAQQQAQKAALAAAELLESGNEDAARAELKRALGLDFQNKLALNLNRQLSADPVALLGRESFNYTVRPGETMSKLAERFLQGDRYAFLILARYNNIAVPKQVAAGQVLRIPGKQRAGVATAPSAPPPGSAPAADKPRDSTVAHASPSPPSPPAAAPPSPPAPPPPPPPPEPTPGEKSMRSAQAAERKGDLATAYLDYVAASNQGQTMAAPKAEQLGRQLVQRYTVAAKGALARQDLDGSITNWQRVLDIEPNNATARSEIERMRTLKKNLGSLK